jgi:hypothetical protein
MIFFQISSKDLNYIRHRAVVDFELRRIRLINKAEIDLASSNQNATGQISTTINEILSNEEQAKIRPRALILSSFMRSGKFIFSTFCINLHMIYKL